MQHVHFARSSTKNIPFSGSGKWFGAEHARHGHSVQHCRTCAPFFLGITFSGPATRGTHLLQKKSEAKRLHFKRNGQPCLVIVDHPAFLPGIVRGVHTVFHDEMCRNGPCQSPAAILRDEDYSCGTCFAIDINHRNFAFKKQHWDFFDYFSVSCPDSF